MALQAAVAVRRRWRRMTKSIMMRRARAKRMDLHNVKPCLRVDNPRGMRVCRVIHSDLGLCDSSLPSWVMYHMTTSKVLSFPVVNMIAKEKHQAYCIQYTCHS